MLSRTVSADIPLKTTLVKYKGTASAQNLPLTTTSQDCRIAVSLIPNSTALPPNSSVSVRVTYPGEALISFVNFYSDITSTPSQTYYLWTDNWVKFTGTNAQLPDGSFIDTLVVPSGTVVDVRFESNVNNTMFGCVVIAEFPLEQFTTRY